MAFRPYIAPGVNQFFEHQLEQAIFSPPVNAQADKGTSNHRTRQFPLIYHRPSLITFIYLSQPVVEKHDVRSIAQSIFNQWNA